MEAGLERTLASGLGVAARCDALTNYLSSILRRKGDLKAFYEFFPRLLVHVFGFDRKTESWFEQVRTRADRDGLLTVLLPSGVLFRTILRAEERRDNPILMFPSARLPGPTRKLLARGDFAALSPLYRGKFGTYQEKNPPSISLTMLEYYLFCFAYAATIDNKPKKTVRASEGVSSREHGLPFFSSQSKPTTSSSLAIDGQQIYVHLVTQYMNFFFPLPMTITSRSLRDSHVSSSSSYSSPSSSLVTTNNRMNINQTLLRTSPYASSPASSYDTRTGDGGFASSSPSSFTISNPVRFVNHGQLAKQFLHIVVEFWLNQNEPLRAVLDTRFYHSPFVMPTETQMRAVLALVEHMREEAAAENAAEMSSTSQVASPLSAGSRRMYSSSLASASSPASHQFSANNPFPVVQAPLYHFLRTAFFHWPSDSFVSLSGIVEIWLTYLQPWRASFVDPTSWSPPLAHEMWKEYIFSNFLFYTSMFLDFLSLAYSKFDFYSISDVYLLEQALMLFGDSTTSGFDVMDAIMEGESYIISRETIPPHRSSFHYEQLIRSHIIQLEGNNYEYLPLLQGEAVHFVEKLIQTLKGSIETPKEPEPAVVSRADESPLKAVVSFFDEKTPKPKVEAPTIRIQHCIHLLCDIFPIRSPGELPPLLPPSAVKLRKGYTNPDTDVDGVHLSPSGKQQVIRGLRKCSNLDVPFLEYGVGRRLVEPLPRPIASWENPFLVRLIHHISKRYNLQTDLRFLAAYPAHLLALCVFFLLFLFWQILRLLFR
ncbi:sphingomyelin phosphodiesterase 4, neutral membrane (neutral sphingomyelinase-3) [Balamuthia mandrillaris]